MGSNPIGGLKFFKIFMIIFIIAWMAEGSKAVDLSSILFGGVGSNPTPSIFLKNFLVKNNIYITWHPWPSGLWRCIQVAVSSESWVRIPQDV